MENDFTFRVRSISLECWKPDDWDVIFTLFISFLFDVRRAVHQVLPCKHLRTFNEQLYYNLVNFELRRWISAQTWTTENEGFHSVSCRLSTKCQKLLSVSTQNWTLMFEIFVFAPPFLSREFEQVKQGKQRICWNIVLSYCRRIVWET